MSRSDEGTRSDSNAVMVCPQIMTRDKTDICKADADLGLTFSTFHALGRAGGERLDPDRQLGKLQTVPDTAVDDNP